MDVLTESFPAVPIQFDVERIRESGDLEELRYAKAFSGKTWREITDKVIARSLSAPALLSTETFSLLLPAYLRASLKSYDAFWALLFRLDPENDPRALRLRALLSDSQCDAVMATMSQTVNLQDADEAAPFKRMAALFGREGNDER